VDSLAAILFDRDGLCVGGGRRKNRKCGAFWCKVVHWVGHSGTRRSARSLRKGRDTGAEKLTGWPLMSHYFRWDGRGTPTAPAKSCRDNGLMAFMAINRQNVQKRKNGTFRDIRNFARVPHGGMSGRPGSGVGFPSSCGVSGWSGTCGLPRRRRGGRGVRWGRSLAIPDTPPRLGRPAACPNRCRRFR
jgi:hypothetical protein